MYPKPDVWRRRSLIVTGREAGRDALGADVTLVLAAGARRPLGGNEGGDHRHQRVASDGSYASASDPRLLFVLAGDERIEAVRVRWSDGSVEEFPPVERARYSTLFQGEGRVLSEPSR